MNANAKRNIRNNVDSWLDGQPHDSVGTMKLGNKDTKTKSVSTLTITVTTDKVEVEGDEV